MDPSRLAGFQLLDLVAKPVKAVILLFPIRGKLEELRQREEAKSEEEGGRVPVDPTVFWIKQTVCFVGVALLTSDYYDGIRSATLVERSAFYMP
jgi:hypothetical protein